LSDTTRKHPVIIHTGFGLASEGEGALLFFEKQPHAEYELDDMDREFVVFLVLLRVTLALRHQRSL
jgi:hypothetical protein